jgi:hypothetical protein
MPRLLACGCRRHFTAGLLKTALLVPLSALVSRSARAAGTAPAPPGPPPTVESRLLDAGADLLQHKKPIDAMSAYLNGFHFYADDMGRQVEAHHFCTHLTEDLHQCVIFDSNAADAKLIGIEYIVSERVFKTLPEDEKRLWHSHDYEVKSGQLIAPGVPDLAEHALMRDLVTTYGKTWHTWQTDRNPALPLGIPSLMMGFTADGQTDPRLVAARDKRMSVSSMQERQNRADIGAPAPLRGANAWESGNTQQLALTETRVKHLAG